MSFDQANGRIAQISNLARTSWYTLLGYLAYTLVTLLTTVDADFFAPGLSVQLPIVGASIPTHSFFWVAPILGSALYVNLHLQLAKLWEVLSFARHTFGGEAVRSQGYPWLINDFALTFGQNNAANRRPLDGIAMVFAWFFVWLAAPMLTIMFWWRSMPVHDVLLTLSIGAFATLGIYAGLTTWIVFREHTNGPGRVSKWTSRKGSIWVSAVVLLAISAVGCLRTSDAPAALGALREIIPISKAALGDTDLIARPKDWRPQDTARSNFRQIWCTRQGLPLDVCGPAVSQEDIKLDVLNSTRDKWCKNHPPLDPDPKCRGWFQEIEEQFNAAWVSERVAFLRSLQQINLNGRDLRHAKLQRTFMPRAFLRGASLDGAKLWETNLERAEMQFASIKYADLWGAQMNANLEYARLSYSNFRSTLISPSWMACSSLRRVNMVHVRLEGSNLSFENWCDDRAGPNEVSGWFYKLNARSTNFVGRKFGYSILEGADLTGAVGLSQEQLQFVVGDDSSVLPLETDGRQLFVWSCWENLPDDFEALAAGIEDLVQRPDFGYGIDKESYTVEKLKDRWLCPEGTSRERVGFPN